MFNPHLTVLSRTERDGDLTFFATMPLQVFAQLFGLHPSAVRRIRSEIETKGKCEIFRNNRDRAAWAQFPRFFSLCVSRE